MPRVTGGRAVVDALRAEGVKVVFGLPGLHNIYVYDALLRQKEIRHILVRHEQGAGYMADGYARTTGEVGVCLTTSGPGATNTLTALATAYADSSPVLLLAAQVDSAYLGQEKGVLHEIRDQMGCFRPVTGWCSTVLQPEAIPGAIHRAMAVMRGGRSRPVVLELPSDVTRREAEVDPPPAPARWVRAAADEESAMEAARLLRQSERPLILAGGGAVSSGATRELVRLAEALGAPVVHTPGGLGAVPDDHPLAVGCLQATRGPIPGLFQAADAVLAVGTRLTHTNTAGWRLPLPANLIHVDLDATEVGRNYPARLGVVGDARASLQRIAYYLEKELEGGRRPWADVPAARAGVRALVAGRPAELAMVDGLRRVLARDAIIFNDASLLNGWSTWFLPVYEPRTFHSPEGSAAMGFGFAAAVGAKVAHPDRQVVSMIGDGGFLFTVQELATCVKYGLGVVVVVYNDNAFGTIKYYQERMFGLTGEVDLVNPDFAALGRAFGGVGMRVEALQDLPDAVAQALASGRPAVVELVAPLGGL